MTIQQKIEAQIGRLVVETHVKDARIEELEQQLTQLKLASQEYMGGVEDVKSNIPTATGAQLATVAQMEQLQKSKSQLKQVKQ